MSDIETARINVALKPSKELSDYMIKLSQDLAKKGEVNFALDGVNFLPHITLYSPEYPKKNIEKIIELAERISKKHKAFSSNFTEIPENEEGFDGFIQLKLKPTEELLELHKELVETLNPLREGFLRQKYLDGMADGTITGRLKDYIIKYGYPKVYDLYRHSLSLAYFKDASLEKEVRKALEIDKKEYLWDSVGVYKMGDFGTCRELIAEFKLNKSN